MITMYNCGPTLPEPPPTPSSLPSRDNNLTNKTGYSPLHSGSLGLVKYEENNFYLEKRRLPVREAIRGPKISYISITPSHLESCLIRDYWKILLSLSCCQSLSRYCDIWSLGHVVMQHSAPFLHRLFQFIHLCICVWRR